MPNDRGLGEAVGEFWRPQGPAFQSEKAAADLANWDREPIERGLPEGPTWWLSGPNRAQ